MFDFNDAGRQMGPIGELIPDGTFCKLQMTIRPGGANGAVPMDAALLKAAREGDVKMLDCEFTVVEGPLARRKFWQNFTVSGGKTDKNGASMGWNMSKATFRAMIDSALGLDFKDESPAAKSKRTLAGLSQLNNIVFVARVMIEPPASAEYSEANRIANVVVPGDPQYAAVMRGEQVDPDPVNAKPKKPRDAGAGQAQGGGAPQWGNSAAPAGAAAATAAPAGDQPAWLSG